jgi:lipopolysaccharide biosynthesis protein
MIGPKHHLVSLKRHMGSNAHILKHLLSRVYNGHIAEKVIAQPEKYPYFGGTMFWARLDALEGILKLQLMPDDFQSEHGQIDGTTAHAIERMLGAVCKLDDKKLYEVDGQGVHVFDREEITEKYKYAP